MTLRTKQIANIKKGLAAMAQKARPNRPDSLESGVVLWLETYMKTLSRSKSAEFLDDILDIAFTEITSEHFDRITNKQDRLDLENADGDDDVIERDLIKARIAGRK